MTVTALPPPLTDALLAQIGALALAEASAVLARLHRLTPATVEQLAALALAAAESDAPRAAHWLAIAEAVAEGLGNPPAQGATLAYTRARLAVHQGDLTNAEASLRQAQSLWQSIGDTASHSRSLLGLTQILAMQGRYDEAESAARAAVLAQLARDVGAKSGVHDSGKLSLGAGAFVATSSARQEAPPPPVQQQRVWACAWRHALASRAPSILLNQKPALLIYQTLI
jgi:tetratricopeptide (TPR) repeat protein